MKLWRYKCIYIYIYIYKTTRCSVCLYIPIDTFSIMVVNHIAYYLASAFVDVLINKISQLTLFRPAVNNHSQCSHHLTRYIDIRKRCEWSNLSNECLYMSVFSFPFDNVTANCHLLSSHDKINDKMWHLCSGGWLTVSTNELWSSPILPVCVALLHPYALLQW